MQPVALHKCSRRRQTVVGLRLTLGASRRLATAATLACENCACPCGQ